MTRRRWTLDAARALLPDVRARTAEAVAQVEALSARRDALPPESPQRNAVEGELSLVVSRWLRAMEALGVDVKGAWLVDFDCGSGYYCWRWPEADLEFFHSYEEGFGGRVRIH